MNNIRSMAACCAVAGCAFPASAATVSDTVFDGSDWSMHQSTYYVPGSTSSASQAVGAGFTGNARYVANSLSGGGGIYGISIYSAFTWSGSVPLTDLTMSIRARSGDYLQAYGFAIEQGGNYWVGGYSLTSSSYQLYTLNLAAADFVTPFGVDPATQPASPDFSGSGAPIRFGFYTANSSSGAAYVTSGYYSDFAVSFVPAPSVLGLLATVPLGARHRRRG